MRLLLVEDDAKTASFILSGLRQNGYAVDHAADGEEGLHMATSEPYDAAVIDIMLPKLDGLVLIDVLRRKKINIPVIILSAKRSTDDRVKGLQTGGDDYLTKPFAFSELLARVQAFIRRAGGLSEPTSLTIGKGPANGYGELFYWADTAIVAGSERLLDFTGVTDRRIRVDSRDNRQVLGWAVDLGARWVSPLPLEPRFTLGFALGSGDPDPDRGRDQSFRQTGLQSNDEEFRTYGELLRPELSNLIIPVFAVEFPIFSNSHVEFAYRRFRQLHPAPFLRDGRLESDPGGINKDIGQEWMIYFGIKEWESAELELVGAAFRTGNAYGSSSGQKAYSLFLKMIYEF